MTKRRLKALLTAAVALLLLVALIRHVDVDAVAQALNGADLLLVALVALGATAINTFQSAEMMRQALATFGIKVTFRLAFQATVGSLTWQAVLPMSTGQLGRAAYVAQQSGTDLLRGSLAAASVLALKLLMLLLLAIAGWLMHPDATLVRGPVILGLIAVMSAAAFMAPTAVHWMATRFGNVKKVGRLLGALDQARQPLRLGAALWTALHALVSVGSELFVFGLLLRAVGASVEPMTIASFFPLVVIGAKVPVTVLGVGTRETLVLAFFQGAAPPAQLLSASLLFSTIEHVLPALIGLLVAGPFLSKLLAGGRVHLLAESERSTDERAPSPP